MDLYHRTSRIPDKSVGQRYRSQLFGWASVILCVPGRFAQSGGSMTVTNSLAIGESPASSWLVPGPRVMGLLPERAFRSGRQEGP